MKNNGPGGLRPLARVKDLDVVFGGHCGHIDPSVELKKSNLCFFPAAEGERLAAKIASMRVAPSTFPLHGVSQNRLTELFQVSIASL
jgi:hypothetical protein